jgi:hypothetical protein
MVYQIYNGVLSNSNDFYVVDGDKVSLKEAIAYIYEMAQKWLNVCQNEDES